MKTEVWLSSGQVKLAAVVLLVIISSQKQLQGLRLQDEQNNETARINLKSKHTWQYLVNEVVDKEWPYARLKATENWNILAH